MQQKRFPMNFLVWMLGGMAFTMFVCGGILAGFYFFDTIRAYTANANLPNVSAIIADLSAEPVVVPTVAPPPNVAAGERINVLLLGIDRREGEEGPWRTDTMIVATFDPQTKTAGMLSIPRDLYVPIPAPGAGENRINTANFYGDSSKYPGGGPALARKTVEYNFAIPIHYYVLVDFDGFRRLIDALGGIDIDVPEAIDDPEYPTEDYGVMHLQIPAGRQHMNGDIALKYARSRKSTSDFDRSKRQMQVILAARDKALKINAIAQAPQLLAQLANAFETDMPPQQILALAPTIAQVRADNIKSRSIDLSMSYEIRLNTGADVLWPDREKIGALIQEMFSSKQPASAVSISPLKAEAARIVILNGTHKDGLAAMAKRYLNANGFNVVQISNAEKRDYDKTVLVDLADKPATLDWLAQRFNVEKSNIRRNQTTERDADIRIILGQDWAPPLEQ
ncbi:MAG: LCP family protein [Anaerolineae bacterium]|nr:LCP family protein [Anaerolineae bacterium]